MPPKYKFNRPSEKSDRKKPDEGQGNLPEGWDDLGSFADLEAQFPGGFQGQPQAIGVPAGYTAVTRHGSRQGLWNPAGEGSPDVGTTYRNITPRFVDGMQYAPASMPPSQIADLQRQLAQLGLIDPDAMITFGVWDETSIAGYEKLLAWANRAGITRVDQALRKYRQMVAEGGGPVRVGGEEPPEIPPLQIRLTDPTSLKATFRRAVIDQLGEGWSDEQIDRMVAAYHSMERENQTQIYNLSYGGPEGAQLAGEVTDVPDAGSYATEHVRQTDPMGVQARDWLEYVQALEDLA
jgi:hypothetical protein